jgi:hypothetical protein
MTYAVEMVLCGMISVPSFKEIYKPRSSVRFVLRNLRGCNFGITDGGDL